MIHHHQQAFAQRQAAIIAACQAFGVRAELTPRQRIEHLQRQQENLLSRSNQLLAVVDAEGRQLTAEESRAISRRTKEIEVLEGEIEVARAEAERLDIEASYS